MSPRRTELSKWNFEHWTLESFRIHTVSFCSFLSADRPRPTRPVIRYGRFVWPQCPGMAVRLLLPILGDTVNGSMLHTRDGKELRLGHTHSPSRVRGFSCISAAETGRCRFNFSETERSGFSGWCLKCTEESKSLIGRSGGAFSVIAYPRWLRHPKRSQRGAHLFDVK